MKPIIPICLVAALALAGCSKKEETAPAPEGAGSSGNPLSAPADYLGAASRAQKKAQQTTATVSLESAVKAFEAEEGKLPKDLNELVTKEYLASLPKPPNGMKFNYDPATGKVTIIPQ